MLFIVIGRWQWSPRLLIGADSVLVGLGRISKVRTLCNTLQYFIATSDTAMLSNTT